MEQSFSPENLTPISPKESPELKGGLRKSVKINGKNWAYLEYGNPESKDIILMLHGWMASPKGDIRLVRK